MPLLMRVINGNFIRTSRLLECKTKKYTLYSGPIRYSSFATVVRAWLKSKRRRLNCYRPKMLGFNWKLIQTNSFWLLRLFGCKLKTFNSRVPSKRVAIVSRNVFWGASRPLCGGIVQTTRIRNHSLSEDHARWQAIVLVTIEFRNETDSNRWVSRWRVCR